MGMPFSKDWFRCDVCGLMWDSLRLKRMTVRKFTSEFNKVLLDRKVLLGRLPLDEINVCPDCRGVSNWAVKVDSDGRV